MGYIKRVLVADDSDIWGNMERKGVANLDGALRQT
jgi:hypothetical protein